MTFKNIVFYGNCQAGNISETYRDFFGRPAGQDVFYMASYEATAGSQAALERADAVVVQEFDFTSQIQISTLRPGAQRFVFPAATAGFLWPFGTKAHPRNKPVPFLEGLSGPYGDQMGEGYLNRLLAENVPFEDAIRMYMDLDVAKKSNLDRLYELYMDRQRKRDQRTGFQLASVIEKYFHSESLFATPDHPNMRVFRYMAEPIFEFLGVTPADTNAALQKLRRPPFPPDEAPIHPAVGRHFGMDYVDVDSRYNFFFEGKFTFEEYARRYYKYEWNSELQEGIWLSHGSDPDLALQILDVGLARTPTSLVGLCRRSSLLDRLGRRDEAIKAAQAAVELWPDEPEGHATLAERLRDDRDLEAAEAAARRAIEVCPVYIPGHQVLATILGETGRGQDAIAAARTAIALRPGIADAHVNLGRQMLRAGDIEGALCSFRNACALRPDNVNFRYVLLDCLINVGRLAEATAELKALLDLQPETAGLHARLASLLLRQNDLPGAEAALARAIVLEPNELAHRRQIADVLDWQGRLNDAGDALKAAAALAPLDAQIRAALSRNLIRRGDLPSAELHLRRAVELEPNKGSMWCDLADVVSIQGRRDEALVLARRAVEIEPSRPRSHEYLGHQLILNGLFDEAERTLRHALRLDAGMASAQRNLALVLARKGLLGDAVAVLREWLERTPGDARAQVMLGQNLAALARSALRDAEGALRAAVQLDPDNIDARITLIEILASLDREADAVEMVRASLLRQPGNGRLVSLASRYRMEIVSTEHAMSKEHDDSSGKK
jgi:tetratricopeptide (TPR) repeat protein